MRKIILPLVAMIVLFAGYNLFLLFTPKIELLGTETFYQSDQITLKALLRYENLPFHYVGYSYSILCESAETSLYPEYKGKLIPKGSKELPGVVLDVDLSDEWLARDDLGALEKIVASAQEQYVVVNDTIVSSGAGDVWVIPKGCSQPSRSWTIYEHLPSSVVLLPTDDVRLCQETLSNEIKMGLVASTTEELSFCRSSYFLNENTPNVHNLLLGESGKISFRVSSQAMGSQELLVSSSDLGLTWNTEVLGISTTTIIRKDGQFSIYAAAHKPNRITVIELRTVEDTVIPLYSVLLEEVSGGDTSTQYIGDNIFLARFPETWVTRSGLRSVKIIIGYSDGQRIERSLELF